MYIFFIFYIIRVCFHLTLSKRLVKDAMETRRKSTTFLEKDKDKDKENLKLKESKKSRSKSLGGHHLPRDGDGDGDEDDDDLTPSKLARRKAVSVIITSIYIYLIDL